MPIGLAFGDEECGRDECRAGREEDGAEVAEVEETADEEAGEEDEGVLERGVSQLVRRVVRRCVLVLSRSMHWLAVRKGRKCGGVDDSHIRRGRILQ